MFLYDANFTMMEVASSANNCAICHYNIYQDTFSTYDTQFLYVIGFHGFTTWKVSKNRVISGPYFPVFSPNPGKYGPEVTLYLDTFHTVLYINCFQSFWFQLSSWYFPVMGGVKRVGGGWWWCVGDWPYPKSQKRGGMKKLLMVRGDPKRGGWLCRKGGMLLVWVCF